jgi:hypothetical protein
LDIEVNHNAVKPNLFIVGAAKCGTTSIVEALGIHPQIFVPKIKEPMFFIPDIGIRTLDSYLNLYNSTNEEGIMVDASTGYLYSENSAEELFQFNPKAKILIVLRNPVHAMYSLWQYMRTMGNEKLSFTDAVLDETKRKEDSFKRTCVGWYANYLYADRYKYTQQVERYLALFPTESTYVVLFEELVANPEIELNGILKFLGLPPAILKLPKSNASGIPRSRLIKRLLDRKGLTLGKLVPRQYRAALRVVLSKMNTSKSKTYATTSELKLAAEKVNLAYEVRELKNILGRSIDVWGVKIS